ncbi:hypothetical protein PFLUV_G00042010 [Perca fluviatilis]|uniref:Uncharacterized protein n=1 Tax=Perca fluviatilis TaxID=8168 RepID=A0A6A5FFE4_PERFL|nr:hypothetical protein PFLUV_G00042010 [Perca fluviatilis]
MEKKQCISAIAQRNNKKRVFEEKERDITAGWSHHASRALHRELLLCHRSGLLPREKPELQCVLEHRQREQHKQKEVALCPPSDLEVKLRTRLQKIQVYELEEEKKSESLQNVPEFVLVRGTLKRIQTFS